MTTEAQKDDLRHALQYTGLTIAALARMAAEQDGPVSVDAWMLQRWAESIDAYLLTE